MNEIQHLKFLQYVMSTSNKDVKKIELREAYYCIVPLLFFPNKNSANFKRFKGKPRVRRLWVFLNAEVGLIKLYLKIQ